MNSESWDEEGIFHIARKLTDPTDRAKYLDQVCGDNLSRRQRIEAMLEVDEKDRGFLKSEPAPTVHQGTVREGPGAEIGPYKLLQKLGEGGMGVVFMADQLRPVTRRVALKIIKPGMDTGAVIARFEAERQALAMMDHPNIAHVLDAGTTDTGRPYFVMELVKGRPITKYCDEQRLTVEQRLRMFLTICRATQHAHQKGIIHRDLKPSNILVAEYDDEAVPKIIDFGVAKAISQRLTDKTMFTALGQVVGTLEYMSPEQAKLNQLDVDIRTDIYSLGVLLYELLTGTTPLEQQRLRTAALDEAVRMIRQEEPPRPSLRLNTSATISEVAARRRIEPARLRRLVRGELDWIVMKALDKDRTRRYEAAATFAEDIRRYLTHERVTARPPTPGYLLRKFARRNRGPVIVGALLLLILLLGLGGSMYGLLSLRDSQQTLAGVIKTLEDSENALLRTNDQLELELYNSHMSDALAAYQRGDFQRATELLARYIPGEPVDSDPRGLEWHYLWNLLNLPRTTPSWTFSNRVSGIDLSTDRRRVAVPVANGTISVFDISPDGRIAEVFSGEIGGATWGRVPFALAPSGELLASMGLDRHDLVIRQLSPYQETRLRTPSEIEGIIAIPHADYFLLDCQFELVRVGWRDGFREAVPHAEKDITGGIDYKTANASPDGKYLAVTDITRDHLLLWDVHDQREEFRILNSSAPVATTAFDDRGHWMATASLDGKIYLHDTRTSPFRASRILHGSLGPAYSLTFSPSGTLLASACADGTIRVWDIDSGRMTRVLRTGDQLSAQFAFLDDDGTILRVSGSSVCVENLDQYQSVPEWKRDGQIREVVFLDQERVASYEIMKANVHVQNTIESMETTLSFSDQIWAMDYCQGIGLAVGHVHGALSIVNIDTGEKVAIDTRAKDVVWSVRFGGDGRHLAAGLQDGIRVWERRNGSWQLEFEADRSGLSLATMADLLAWGDESGNIEVWDWRSREQLWTDSQHRAEVYSVEFSPDGSNLLTCSLDGSIKLWNTVDGHLLAERAGEASPWCGIFVPDDSAILTTGLDGYVTIRDRQTLASRFRFPRLNGPGKCLAFSPSGNRLAVGTFLGQLQVWDLGSANRQELVPPEVAAE